MTAVLMMVTMAAWSAAKGVVSNPKAVSQLLDRIGGKGTSRRLHTVLDPSMGDGQETFVITSRKGKPCIKGSTLSAITTGVNWYLNHYAHVNLTWNHLTTDLSSTALPVPIQEESHACDAQYRYYLNYCTFGYSMTTWTWERWQKEIDWMALHGINMPLQIVGLEQVWKAFLIDDCGYSEHDAEAFVPGPAYIAWWGMNNLEGWGGTEDDGWYERQAQLGRKICDRQRELGMQPVLPGFSGMVPSNFTDKTGNAVEKANLWCRFTRPDILDPTSQCFAQLAEKYYKQLEKVMGRSRYYSMDPFHEGGTIKSGRYSEGYKAVYDAMNQYAGSDSKWVIQQWQWAAYQKTCLTAVPEQRLIVLDLFSDGNPAFDWYAGYAPQEAVYCAIPNYGGRTGFFGRLPKMADNYYAYKQKYATVKGIGVAPEAIEQTTVAYDMLFELPWMGHQPDTKAWMKDYVKARYGVAIPEAEEAWEILRTTALNNTTSLQGPHEAVMCARPALKVWSVSTWGGTDIFYKDHLDDFERAVRLLLSCRDKLPDSEVARQNYSFDLCDLTRQLLSDRSYYMLEGIREAHEAGDTNAFEERRDQFMALILDLDELLGTNQMFRLGNWTETARQAATEVRGWTEATQDWFELDNARTLITTWGAREHSEWGGLHDYSYRQWQGMLRDFYYPRWQYYFSHNLQAPEGGWFDMEWAWAHAHQRYAAAPEGDTHEVATRLLKKYKR